MTKAFPDQSEASCYPGPTDRRREKMPREKTGADVISDRPSMSGRSKDANDRYQIPVRDRPNPTTLNNEWKIRDQRRDRVVLEPVFHDEEAKYRAQPLELYTSRLSLSYNKQRLDALDKVSSSYSSNLGKPMTGRYSTSYAPLSGGQKVSTGWRVWSRVETGRVTSPAVGSSSFDRTYSRNYERTYSRPYNTDPVISVAAYSTGYRSSHSDRYSNIGSYQDVARRPNRDYKSRLGGSYQVRSYNREVTQYGRHSSY